MSKVSNNKYIHASIFESFKFSGEQLEADKLLEWKHLSQHLKVLSALLWKRLDDGAEKYEQEVPIFEYELNGRDNLAEAIEEIADASVYATAEKVRLSSKEYKGNERAQQLIKMLLTYLSYSYLIASELLNVIKKDKLKKE